MNRWNEIISDEDIVYHLGDFCFGNGARKKELGNQLKGHKHLIRGSHDGQIPNGIFESISDVKFIRPDMYGEDITLKHQGIFMSHYMHKTWDESHYGSWHLCGHSHGRMNTYAEGEGKILDVGVDNFNFYPVSLDEVIEIMRNRPDNYNYIGR
jgi:calcineurin-like phosphoesterase family protein